MEIFTPQLANGIKQKCIATSQLCVIFKRTHWVNSALLGCKNPKIIKSVCCTCKRMISLFWECSLCRLVILTVCCRHGWDRKWLNPKSNILWVRRDTVNQTLLSTQWLISMCPLKGSFHWNDHGPQCWWWNSNLKHQTHHWHIKILVWALALWINVKGNATFLLLHVIFLSTCH